MTNIQIVSREAHIEKRWLRPTGYRFAEKHTVCPIVVDELPKAMMALPTAFVRAGDAYSLVTLQGLESNQNLLVGKGGQWLAGYIPASYRGYPFVLADTPDNNQILCIDENSDLITDSPIGEVFFLEDGTPSEAVADILSFLTHLYKNQQKSIRICALLNKYELIQPWPIKLQRDSSEQTVEGLYRIDETTLNSLEGEALAALRDSGALVTAYCQLLSMQQLSVLGNLLQTKEQKSAPKELDLDFLNDSGNISFGDL